MGSAGATGKLGDAYIGTSSFEPVIDLVIFIKDCSDEYGSKRPLTVKPWSTIKDVKDRIFHLMAIPTNVQRLFVSGPLQNYGVELPNHWTLHDAGVYKSGATLALDLRRGFGSYVPETKPKLGLDEGLETFPYLRNKVESRPYDVRVAPSMKEVTPKVLKQMIQKSMRGFLRGFKPELVLEGSGGTYFLHDARKIRVGVFKPSDEEPYAENNPRGYINTNSRLHTLVTQFSKTTEEDIQSLSLRAGVKPGESCLREVAAFLLDHGSFCSVPMTTLVVARHPAFHNSGTRLKVYEGGAGFGPHSGFSGLVNSPRPSYGVVVEARNHDNNISCKTNSLLQTNLHDDQLRSKIGSFQEFVRSECTMDDLSPSLISVDEVHKIALLDIRLLNADRNVGNLLVKRKQDNTLALVPIDHGYCLRSVCDVASFDWCWLEWKQTKEPVSKATKDYIMSLDIVRDVSLLKDVFHFSQKALDYFRAANMILQEGIKAGLTIYDIANMVCRHDFDGDSPSTLEILLNQASDFAYSALENGRWHHSAASRALENKLTTINSISASASQVRERMFRAASNSSIINVSYVEKRTSVSRNGSPPPSANTSYSEDSGGSSVGSCEGEDNDCAGWAAAVVADVSPDANNFEFIRTRSGSLASSTTDESSTASHGFWTTRPGTASNGSNVSCTESFTSSKNCSLLSMKDTTLDAEQHENNDTIPCVNNFHEVSLFDHQLPTTFVPNERESLPSKQNNHNIKRSQSYSAFSVSLTRARSTSMVSFSPKQVRRGPISAADKKQHRDYFLKFMALLIEREVHVASHARNMQSY